MCSVGLEDGGERGVKKKAFIKGTICLDKGKANTFHG